MKTMSKMKPKGKRKIQFPTIGADSKALKVDRIHLWKVLTGRRVSASLMERYEKLKAEQKGASV